jgi:hypothetical protein
MRKTMQRVGDSVLQRLLPELEAGACVPENGQLCKCDHPCGVNWCTQYRFNCHSLCYANGRC